MPRDRATIGNCPQCQGGNFVCTYNHFERDELTITSWEHKCADCGKRETTAFRSDDEEPIPVGVDSGVCPYCSRVPGEADPV